MNAAAHLGRAASSSIEQSPSTAQNRAVLGAESRRCAPVFESHTPRAAKVDDIEAAARALGARLAIGVAPAPTRAHTAAAE